MLSCCRSTCLSKSCICFLSRTSMALMVYRGTIAAGEKPTIELVSQVLGCLQIPCDATLKNRLVENLGVTAVSSRYSNLCSLVDGFGEYDPRAFSLLEVSWQLKLFSQYSNFMLCYEFDLGNQPRFAIYRKLPLLELCHVYPSKRVLLPWMLNSCKFILPRWVFIIVTSCCCGGSYGNLPNYNRGGFLISAQALSFLKAHSQDVNF